ncbi:hypothetical protein [Bifidobacterium tissieri]|uniref:Uncharacterized protein n=1 Tax=Bifidobacterium tissieri TaxID=1630162 RepID=A0A5M9ZVG3_9BIFI|nr:hypothetical protein [Bifidobacterium tissieri]KAA8828683.1 hypothetical protein EM849_11640 [Bifidobacterium tissieri]KAA8831626.1 hypothetical protein EMO89_02555 [Bifidobacterium tissieri]
MPDGSPRPPVKQPTIASWEGARGIPETIDLSIRTMCDAIEDMGDQMVDLIKNIAEHSANVRNTPDVTIIAYGSDAALWKAWPNLTGWPHTMWNVAATIAMDELEDELGIIPVMVSEKDTQ